MRKTRKVARRLGGTFSAPGRPTALERSINDEIDWADDDLDEYI